MSSVNTVGCGLPIVFVLGTPRSGTTLLSALLNLHPDLLVPPEPWLMLGCEAFGRFHPDLPADGRLICLATKGFIEPDLHIAAARAYVLAVVEQKLAAGKRRVFVEKTPRNYLILDFIRSVFPEARFIRLVRNPLDVAASIAVADNWKVQDALVEGGVERHGMDLVLGAQRLAEFARDNSECVHTLKYEDLVAEPAAELAKVFGFLGLPETEIRTDFAAGLDKFAASHLGDRKLLSTTAPHTRSVGAWRAAFEPTQLQLLLDGLGEGLMRDLGYGAVLEELAALGVRSLSPHSHVKHRHRYEGFVSACRETVDAALIPTWLAPHASRPDTGGDRVTIGMATVQRLESELAASREECRGGEAVLAASQAECRRLEAELTASQAECRRFEAELAASQAACRRFESGTEVANRSRSRVEREAMALRRELSAIASELQMDAERLLTARSWTITRPLRNVSNRLRGRALERHIVPTYYWCDTLTHMRNVHASLSWDIAAPLRLFGKLTRRLRRR